MKTKPLIGFLFLSLVSSVIFFGCSRDVPVNLQISGYPNEVGKILLSKCAVSGCHTDISKDAAGGISLTSWSKLFEGGDEGAVIIPYSTVFSSLLYHVNTYPDLGLALQPTMPLGNDVLTHEEVTILRNWIAQGAPDRNGYVAFSENQSRKKIYVVQQGCDVVAVIDAKTKLVMRYISIGNDPNQIESPHMIRISPDGQYWYVCFLNSTVFQKYRTSDDALVGEANVGIGSWNTFAITSNSQKAFLADWSSPGKILYINLKNMTVLATYQSASPGYIDNPHGIVVNKDSTFLYVGTTSPGNFFYKIDITNPFSEVVNQQPFSTTTVSAHEVLFSPDESNYFITCNTTNEVRIMKTSNDSLIAIIPTGDYPLEMAVSTTTPYCFVTCENDAVIFPGANKKGLVTVFNYVTHQFVANIDVGTYQPHGIAVDDANGWVYVASRNISGTGPPPHHTSVCAGRNGYITIIDLNTLQKVEEFQTELSVDPYSIAVRK